MLVIILFVFFQITLLCKIILLPNSFYENRVNKKCAPTTAQYDTSHNCG